MSSVSIKSGFKEALDVFKGLLFRVIWQQSLFLVAIFFIFGYIFKQPLSAHFFVGFIFSTCCFGLMHTILFNSFGKSVFNFETKGRLFYSEFLEKNLKEAFNISWIVFFAIIFFSGLVFLSKSAVLGGLTGAALLTFLLRVGGGMYQVCAEVAPKILKNLDESFPIDERNPAFILDSLGNFVGAYLGRIQDTIFSILFLTLLPVLFFDNVLYICIKHPLFWLSLGLLLVSFVSAFWVLLKRIKYSTHNALLEYIYIFLGILLILSLFVLGALMLIDSALFYDFKTLVFGVSLGSGFIALMMGLNSFYVSSSYSPLRRTAESAQFSGVFPLLHAAEIGLQSNGVLFFVFCVLQFLIFHSIGTHILWYSALGLSLVLLPIIMVLVFSSAINIVSKWVCYLEDDVVMESTKKHFFRAEQLSKTVSIFESGFPVLISICLSLIVFIKSIELLPEFFQLDIVWVAGAFIGLSLASFYSSVLMQAIMHLMSELMNEVRRQFREIPHLLEGKVWPDIAYSAKKQSVLVFKLLLKPGVFISFMLVLAVFGLPLKLFFGLVFGVFIFTLCQSYQWANLGDVILNSLAFVQQGRLGGKRVADNLLRSCQFSSSFQVVLAQATQFFLKVAVLFYLIMLTF